ncbi:hypothetical protein F2P81_020603 [Scophthalmus maximus]|uniref:Uncharacterized protein n=1 Tax=Scophthalmus maximus TaxID=52904 RepID=A0A6A4SAV1_SCOMX|nr:hypothetical protein F2P81_020603 [Scophthalmus maximus]
MKKDEGDEGVTAGEGRKERRMKKDEGDEGVTAGEGRRERRERRMKSRMKKDEVTRAMSQSRMSEHRWITGSVSAPSRQLDQQPSRQPGQQPDRQLDQQLSRQPRRGRKLRTLRRRRCSSADDLQPRCRSASHRPGPEPGCIIIKDRDRDRDRDPDLGRDQDRDQDRDKDQDRDQDQDRDRDQGQDRDLGRTRTGTRTGTWDGTWTGTRTRTRARTETWTIRGGEFPFPATSRLDCKIRLDSARLGPTRLSLTWRPTEAQRSPDGGTMTDRLTAESPERKQRSGSGSSNPQILLLLLFILPPPPLPPPAARTAAAGALDSNTQKHRAGRC